MACLDRLCPTTPHPTQNRVTGFLSARVFTSRIHYNVHTPHIHIHTPLRVLYMRMYIRDLLGINRYRYVFLVYWSTVGRVWYIATSSAMASGGIYIFYTYAKNKILQLCFIKGRYFCVFCERSWDIAPRWTTVRYPRVFYMSLTQYIRQLSKKLHFDRRRKYCHYSKNKHRLKLEIDFILH